LVVVVFGFFGLLGHFVLIARNWVAEEEVSGWYWVGVESESSLT
jgi:hypothetical protein